MINTSKYIYIVFLLIFCISCSTKDKEERGIQIIEKNKKYIDNKISVTRDLKKQSKLAEAVQALDSAIQVSNKTKNYKLYHLLNNKASVLASIGEEILALNLFQKTTDIARENGDKLEEFKVLANIGILNSKIDNQNKALDIFNEAINFYKIELTKEQKEKYSLSPIYNSKGDIYLRRKKLDSAFVYYKLSADGETHPIVKNAFYNNASNIYRKKKEYESAHGYIDKAIAFSSKQKSNFDLSKALINKAKIFIDQKKYADALSSLKKSEELLDNSHFQLNNEFKETKLKYYVAKKDFKNAYEIQNKLNKTKEVAETAEKNKRVVNLTLLYDLKGKADKIKELQFEDELKVIKIENQRTIILLSFFAIIVLSILIYLYAKRLKEIKDLNKSLVAKNLALANSERKQIKIAINKKGEESSKPANESRKPVLDSNSELKQKLIQDLELFSKNREALCDNDVTLSFLAKKLNTNQKYLSSIINEHYNCNFSSFLNERRIRESCLMLTEQEFKNYSIEAISKEAGFSSKSAFNKAFKKYTGLTPSVFQKYKNQG